MIPIALIAAGLSASVAFVGGYQVASQSYRTEIAGLKQSYAQASQLAAEKAHAETIRLQRQADDAQRLARSRQSNLARDLAANRDALGRLRDAADSALRDAQGSHDACRSRASTLVYVFGRCAGQLTDLAATADRLASDKQTLIDSWPR